MKTNPILADVGIRDECIRLLEDATGEVARLISEAVSGRDPDASVTRHAWSNRAGSVMGHASWLPRGDRDADAIEVLFEVVVEADTLRLTCELVLSDGTVLENWHDSALPVTDPAAIPGWVDRQLAALMEKLSTALPAALARIAVDR